ncbi:Holliday junction resolvase RecU [Mycoplasma ovis]|uniref:Holliday junction resolvase RecU n=1 Tax=Mycoplasma ovis TaxID=171632 RepID=UPI000400F9BA|nr:Holliday junction resolvase RecU [Mycoplasma ovis]
MYHIKHNLGAFVEKIMSHTAEYYINNNIAYFKKSHPEYIHVSKKSMKHTNLFDVSEHTYSMKVCSKGDLDFYGVYKGRYFSIELKETKKEIFTLSLLKQHQLEKLEKINSCGGVSLLLIHFFLQNSHFVLISYTELLKLLKLNKSKRFSLSDLRKIKSYELKIIFPSIFNLKETLDQILLDN